MLEFVKSTAPPKQHLARRRWSDLLCYATTVLDRRGREAAACSCYATDQKAYAELL